MEGRRKCKACKDWQEHYYWNHLGASKKRFIKVMAGDFSQRLRIPKKFVENYRGELSGTVNLRGPSGKEWRVTLERRSSTDVFLQSGWSDFVEAHGIEENDNLVFEGNGDSGFDILVFEKTGCQKASSYFNSSGVTKNREMKGHPLGTQNVIHQCDSSTSQSDAAGTPSWQTPSYSSSFDRKAGDEKTGEHLQTKEKHDKTRAIYEHDENFRMRKARFLGGANPALAKCYIPLYRGLTYAQEERAKQLCNAVKEGNPSFVSVMRQTSCVYGFILSIIFSFAGAHLPLETQYIYLQTPRQEKKWSVCLLADETRAYFSQGWKQFVLDNKLKEGDLCLFELTEKSKQIIMTVHISRAAVEAIP